MIEAENIVNGRPLSTENLNDPFSVEPLTPNHFLTLKSKLVLPPPGRFVKQDVFSRKKWRRVQYLIDQLWKRWQKEYLQSLQVRQKWTKCKRNVQVDDIVVIKDSNLPRNMWSLGRIVEVMPDDTGHVRKVKLLVSDPSLDAKGKRTKAATFLERPIHSVVLLLENEPGNSPSESH